VEHRDDEAEILPPATLQARKGKEKIEIAPINWMKGQIPFTIQDTVDGPDLGLTMTLQELRDCSPRLRRHLAELLRFSVLRVQKKRLLGSNTSKVPAALHSTKLAVGREVVSEESPAVDENIDCHYIEAWVGGFRIPEVLLMLGQR